MLALAKGVTLIISGLMMDSATPAIGVGGKKENRLVWLILGQHYWIVGSEHLDRH